MLSVEEFTLNDLISSVDAIIRPMAKEKGQIFNVEVTGVKHEYLLGDETRVNQVLINLLSNAVKYTQAGGNIWLRIIGLKQRSSQFEHIRIEVEDNGYGMTPEYLVTIFDAFTRAENSTTNKVQGTGLGMAITKNIVELMGGTIDVSSEVDKGSLFRVELEFRIPDGQADKRFWKESGSSDILVVGTDGQNAMNIQMLMKDMDIMVDWASGAEEALSIAQDSGMDIGKYQMILLDWAPEEGTGMQELLKIRELISALTPVLLLANYDAEGLDDALRMENTGILSKPFFHVRIKG